jgi:NAD(P)-dependent dehydrogenase (short-subunit alcohol dehydrogenase family)
MEIAGLAAVVSGGASGLGRATAEMLVAGGARVAILDVNPDAVTKAAAEIGALGIAADVTDAEGLEAAMDQARRAHGSAAIAVACAGIAPAKRIVGRDGPMPLADFQRVISVNLIGSFNLLRLAAGQMAGRTPNADGERGVVVMTASIAGYEGQIGQAAYAASKAGVIGLTLPAARELAGSGVRVVSVAPGLFGTPMLLGMPQEVQDSLTATLPFPKRFGNPAEFAGLVRHIVENPVLNGETIRLDSALRMQPK